MKKRGIALALACVLLLGTAGCGGAGGKRPFSGLEASDIVSATVRLTPPDKTLRIEEREELAACLRDTVIYREDASYTEYDGQGVTFTLTLADGSRREIMAYYPFLVVDGVGYRTEYAPCEALSQYANQLLREGEAPVILNEPPVLTVVSDRTAYAARLGSYSWQRENDDGTCTGVESDSPHPLQCRESLSPALETGESSAVLRFQTDPDEIISVRCWGEEAWTQGAADAPGEELSLTGGELPLKSGGHIYEVVARWDTHGGCGGGQASYAFYMAAP